MSANDTSVRGDTFNGVEARPRSSQYTKDMTVAAGTELRMDTVARSRLDLDTRVFYFVGLNDVRAARPLYRSLFIHRA